MYWKMVGLRFTISVNWLKNTKNFKEFLDVFTRKVQVGFVRLDVDDVDFLEENNKITMMLLRKETLYITNFAIVKVQEIKEA